MSNKYVKKLDIKRNIKIMSFKMQFTPLHYSAFFNSAPTLWNSRPVNIKSVGNIIFRRKLKTYLFKLAYRP